MADVHLFTPLFRRRTVPLPTWRLWVILVIILVATLWLVPHRLYRALAVTDPAGGGILVIEGWVPDQTVDAGVARFRTGAYTHLVTTGVPIEYGAYLFTFGSSAEVARATCLRLGIDSLHVSAAPARGHIARDRTLASAYALRAWLHHSAPDTRQIDIVTQGVHAWRTRMIFARVLGDSVRVGIIATPETQYTERDWWKTSAGVKDMAWEIAGTVLAVFTADEPPREE